MSAANGETATHPRTSLREPERGNARTMTTDFETDKIRQWHAFSRLMLYAVIALVILLGGMGIFLV
jgi:hypothetical protein